MTIPHWKAAMDEEMSALLSRGTWTLVLSSVVTEVVGYRWVQMDILLDTESDLLPKALLKPMVLTSTPFLQWLVLAPFGFRSRLLSIKIGRCSSLTLKIPSCMVICRKQFTWSNLQGMLLRGSLKFANSRRLSIASNRAHVHGLISSIGLLLPQSCKSFCLCEK